MAFDDQPQTRYSTGHDPGGAAVVSIAFSLWCGWLALLAMAGSRWLRLGLVVMAPLSCFAFIVSKREFQWMLYVRNAQIIDPLILLAVSGIVAVASVCLTRHWGRLATVLVSVPVAFAASIGFAYVADALSDDNWNPAWPDFVLLASCRVLVPYSFWTLLLPRSLDRPSG